MRLQSRVVMWCAVALLAGLAPGAAAAQEKKGSVCALPQPEQVCTVRNTCGSLSNPCVVDIKRTGDSAEVTADITDRKGNALFCVKAGTSVRWWSPAKNVGFLVDFEPAFPFDAGEAIIGGSNRPVSVVATRKGCYRYSAGACASGARYGMCKTIEGEMIVTE